MGVPSRADRRIDAAVRRRHWGRVSGVDPDPGRATDSEHAGQRGQCCILIVVKPNQAKQENDTENAQDREPRPKFEQPSARLDTCER